MRGYLRANSYRMSAIISCVAQVRSTFFSPVSILRSAEFRKSTKADLTFASNLTACKQTPARMVLSMAFPRLFPICWKKTFVHMQIVAVGFRVLKTNESVLSATITFEFSNNSSKDLLTHLFVSPHKYTPLLTCLAYRSPAPFLSVAARLRRGRHKGERAAAARAGTRTSAKQTADQMRVLETPEQLALAADCRGVAAQSARPGRWQQPCGLPS
jgi:hypothetical protein